MSSVRLRGLAAAAVVALPFAALSAAPAQADTGQDAYQSLWDTAWNDHDLDGLSNAREAELGTDPQDPDTDDDGLSDSHELRGVGTKRQPYYGPTGFVAERVVPTNPLLADTDGDGLDDAQENLRYTDPADADTDDDGLADGQEVAGTRGADGTTYVTNPLAKDSDYDRIPDADELQAGTSPIKDPAARGRDLRDEDVDGLPDSLSLLYATDPTKTDTDDDGAIDGVEVLGYGNYDWGSATQPGSSYSPSGRIADTDEDGLTDGQEIALGTNAIVADTDGDGFTDAQEGYFIAPGVDWFDRPLVIHVDPLNPDQNRNGVLDGQEFDLQWMTRA